jgi:YVTN family beta-propeller protein
VINDTALSVVASVPVGASPYGATYVGANAEVYVTNGNSATVSIISDSTNSVVTTVAVGPGPLDAAYDPQNAEVFVANSVASTVSVIDTVNASIVATVGVGDEPTGVAYDLGNSSVYVTDEAQGTLSILAAPAVFTLTITQSGIPVATLAKYGWTVAVDGIARHVFTGDVDFPLLPNGTYPVLVQGPSGFTSAANEGVEISGTTQATVSFSRGATYLLQLTERGLPTGQPWCVEVDYLQRCTTTSSLRYLNLTPGSYPYVVVSPVSGQSITARVGTTFYPLNGSLALSRSETLALSFVYRYPVTFTETGLLSGTSWSVTVRGVELSSTGTTIRFDETNGTYGYSIAAIPGLQSVASPRPVRVHGGPGSVTVTFARRITFAETGLPRGTEWGVNLSGPADLNETVRAAEIALPLGEGSYALQFWSEGDYSLGAPSELNVTPTMGPTVHVTYDRAVLTFVEAGLYRGTEWGVNLTGPIEVREATSAASISIPLEDGTYSVQFWTLNGYTTTGTTEVNVTARVDQTVRVAYDHAKVTLTESGLPRGADWGVNLTCSDSEACGATSYQLTSSGGSVSVELQDGTYSVQYWNVNGYTISNSPPTSIVVVGTVGQAIHVTYRTA